MALRHFEKFFTIAEKLALKKKYDLNELRQIGETVLAEYKTKGHLTLMPHDSLKLEYYSMIPLLRHLLDKHNNPEIIQSPVENLPNSNWMAESSFCFINIRGTGASPHTHGDFINAAKLLPVLRVTSIHLAPFFECALEIIYGIDSLTIIDENTVNKDFLKVLFMLEGLKPRYDLERKLDWKNYGRVLVFEKV